MKPSDIGIKLSNISRSFGKTQALGGLTLTLEQGALHGFIGPDGAGKTTLFRMLAGLLKSDTGSIKYFDSSGELNFEELRPHIAYMPSKSSLYPDLSIKEHLIFFRDLYGLSNGQFSAKSKELLEITRLDKFIDRKIGELSGGMYKKAGLMCALLQSPSAMLLDEPTNGVDPISRREFWELLYRLVGEKILILISTSYMDEAERCAQVHLLESGKVLASGAPDELLARYKAKGFDEIFAHKAII